MFNYITFKRALLVVETIESSGTGRAMVKSVKTMTEEIRATMKIRLDPADMLTLFASRDHCNKPLINQSVLQFVKNDGYFSTDSKFWEKV